jgi:hypothetical protein
MTAKTPTEWFSAWANQAAQISDEMKATLLDALRAGKGWSDGELTALFTWAMKVNIYFAMLGSIQRGELGILGLRNSEPVIKLLALGSGKVPEVWFEGPVMDEMLQLSRRVRAALTDALLPGKDWTDNEMALLFDWAHSVVFSFVLLASLHRGDLAVAGISGGEPLFELIKGGS